jgi:hypothetical protein
VSRLLDPSSDDVKRGIKCRETETKILKLLF